MNPLVRSLLLTGRSPHESATGTAQETDVINSASEILPASRLNPDLASDIDYIIRKALCQEPEERYVSVEAFANDMRAFLESRPVLARSGNARIVRESSYAITVRQWRPRRCGRQSLDRSVRGQSGTGRCQAPISRGPAAGR